jgi:hypothetical protein
MYFFIDAFLLRLAKHNNPAIMELIARTRVGGAKRVDLGIIVERQRFVKADHPLKSASRWLKLFVVLVLAIL